ncbi:hypothetical protein GSI_14787 [Ganoderma sinense ZZ0214-1]|uniref:Uncharacterized protein n=1 Tax=Ganoderma sinense ZZ0214-1 TaxID=1077348 RepID=A0A2G8RPP9_9APHY|nr:hypothetical protein GSI_14787 [Ganoderma sinense ZZ0214-1]
MPASITYIAVDDVGDDRHRICVELSPLALQDVIGLDYLASFARPVDDEYPRGVVISGYLTGDEARGMHYAFGTGILDALWTEVFLDDYILIELSVSRAYDTTRSWRLQFNLLAATRIATSP